jgi:histone H3/H4
MSSFSYDFGDGALPGGLGMSGIGVAVPAAVSAMPPPAVSAAAAAAPAAADAFDPAGLPAQLDQFWEKQMKDIVHLCATDKGFKNHNDLPLARIKRIMKSDEDVRMIRAEAPVLFAKACELFILELTLRSSAYSEKTERRNLQKNDIMAALANTDIFDFLHDVLTQNDGVKGGGAPPPGK